MVWLVLLAVLLCFGFSGFLRVLSAIVLFAVAGVVALVALLLVAA